MAKKKAPVSDSPPPPSTSSKKPFWKELEQRLSPEAQAAWRRARLFQRWTSLWTPITVLAIALGLYMTIVSFSTCTYLWLQSPMKVMGATAALSLVGLVLLFGGPAARWAIRFGDVSLGQWGGPFGARGVELIAALVLSWLDDWRLTGALFGLGFGFFLSFRGVHPWRQARHDRYVAEELLNEVSMYLKSRGVPEKVRNELWKAADEVARAFALEPARLPEVTQALDALIEKHDAVLKIGSAMAYAGGLGKALLVAVLIRVVLLEPFKIPSGSMIPTLEIGDQIFVNKFIYGVQIPFTHIVPFKIVREPKRGDVIVFKNEHANPQVDYIKRVIGVPGDRIEQKDHLVYVNGKPVRTGKAQHEIYVNGVALDREVELEEYGFWSRDERRSKVWEHGVKRLVRERVNGTVHRQLDQLDSPESPAPNAWGPQPAIVPPGSVLVMGDNRESSEDSRYGLDGPEEAVAFVKYGSIKGKAMVIWLSLSHGGWLSSFFEGTGIRADRFFLPVDMCGNEPRAESTP